MNDIGAAIYAYRKKHEMSQQAFADRAELSLCYICEIENGKRIPGRKALRDITKVLKGEEKNG